MFWLLSPFSEFDLFEINCLLILLSLLLYYYFCAYLSHFEIIYVRASRLRTTIRWLLTIAWQTFFFP